MSITPGHTKGKDEGLDFKRIGGSEDYVEGWSRRPSFLPTNMVVKGKTKSKGRWVKLRRGNRKKT